MILDATWAGLAVALGAGLLIGIERERRKGEGADRAAAGLRTFTVAALAGALAQASGSAALVAVGAAGVAMLAALSYRRSAARDPGLTTELALIATYLIGALAVPQSTFAAAAAVVLASVLASRARLHRFATRWLSEAELHDGLLLAALALVVVPLMPTTGLAWLGGIAPRNLAWLVLLVLAVQAAGHVAQRIVGARAGLALSGLIGGFVSSSATVAAMGARARAASASAQPSGASRVPAAAAVLSGAATWALVLVLAAGLSPSALSALAPMAVGGLSGALAAGGTLWLGTPRPAAGDDSVEPADASALSVRAALLVAVLTAAVSLGVSQAQSMFGTGGLLAGAALAALVDAHAPVGSALALHAAARLATPQLVWTVLVAVAANSVSRSVIALASGGAGFAARVAVGLFVSLAAAGSTVLLWPPAA